MFPFRSRQVLPNANSYANSYANNSPISIDDKRQQTPTIAPYQLTANAFSGRHKNNIVLYCPRYCPPALPSLPAHPYQFVLRRPRHHAPPYASERHPRSILISVLVPMTRKYTQQDASLVSTLFNAMPTICQPTPTIRQRLRTRLFQAHFYAYNLYL